MVRGQVNEKPKERRDAQDLLGIVIENGGGQLLDVFWGGSIAMSLKKEIGNENHGEGMERPSLTAKKYR